MRERVTVEMILRADQPIHHGDGNDGNSVAIKRRRFMGDDGYSEVPYVSGTSMAHHMRSAGSWSLMKAAGLLDDPQLSEGAQRLLFNGGMISGSSKALKIAEANELIELLPHIGLLGGCVSNSIREGTTDSDSVLLVCEETAPFLPGWVGAWLAERGRKLMPECEHITTEQGMKRTLDGDPSTVRLLSSGARADVDERLAKREAATRSGDDAAKLASKSDAMIYEWETVCAGSLWYWRVAAWVHSEIERDAFSVMLGTYLKEPHIGGKVHRDHGRVSVVEVRARGLALEPASDEPLDTISVEGVTSPEAARYVAHVAERRGRIVDLLARVIA